MSALVDKHTWTAKYGSTVLEISKDSPSEIGLDRNWSPYAQGSLTIVMPDAVTFAALDPRFTVPHITLDVERRFSDFDFTEDETVLWGGLTTAALTTLWGGLTTAALTNYAPHVVWNAVPGVASRRQMVLSVRGRDVNQDQTVTLSLASDDAYPGDILVNGPPYGGWVYVYETVRAYLTPFLAEMGFTLPAGSADALIPLGNNPSVPDLPGVMYMGGSTWAEQFELLLLNSNLKLWCDEAGVWHLDYPDYSVSGTITLTASSNLSSQAEHIERSSDAFATRVIVRYTYPDPTTGETVYDDFVANSSDVIAGDAWYFRKTARLDFATFPSYSEAPAMAQAVVDRMAKRGREVPVDAVSDYQVTPGMTLAVTTSWGPALHGPITGVRWRHPQNQMTVLSENLTP